MGIGISGAFSVDTVKLYENGERRLAILNAAGNLVLSLAGIGLAWLLVAVVGL